MKNKHNPKVINFYHPSYNIKGIEEYGKYSKEIVWWQCDKGHEWERSITSLTETPKCPICSSLSYVNPSLAAQWHPTKNLPLQPIEVKQNSGKKVWWQCDKGHEWEATVNNRSNGKSCPVCAIKNRSVTRTVPEVEKSLQNLHPSLSKEWHPTKNGNLNPTQVRPGSPKKVWWQCDKQHEWETSVRLRAKAKTKCPYCSGVKTLINFNTLNTNESLASEWHPTKNGNLNIENIPLHYKEKVWWKCEKEHEWEAAPTDRNRKPVGTNCPKCANQISSAEEEIVSFLHMVDNKILNTRRVIPPVELDVYIPEKNVAIEYNGLYWHSEKFKTKTYHYDKWLACKKQGIQLIQVWEDDWKRNPELVKRMLETKLQISKKANIYARNTVIKKITKDKTKFFLNNNHIQGFTSGSYYLGLFDRRDIKKLVAVLVLKKEPGTNGKTLNIIRYATSQNVVGGFTKLLKYAEKTYEPERFITFSDNCVSDGGLYENNGFIADKQLAPDYTYLVKGERKHKFGYRLKRFRNDPELKYEPGLTERELAALNGLPRVWDAGKTRWIKFVK